MLEHLINEDEQKAKELFHDIVVAKSREIYETLISEDFDMEENLEVEPTGEPAEEPEMEASDDEFSGDDATDDMMGDIEGGDDMGSDDMSGDDVSLSGGDVDELQDRVVDLEDALDALRDEFESLMGGEEGGDDMGGDDMGDAGVPEMDGGMSQEMPAMERRGNDEDEDEKTDEAFIREYVEKVTAAKGGDNGVNAKSIVAKKNDMGGTSGNLNKGFTDSGKGGTQGGLLNPSTKDLNSGNVNVPGGKAGVKHLKTVSGGHGAEKKSTGDNGANTKSPLNGAPGRAK